MRRKVLQIVEREAPSVTKANLQSYLDGLVNRARAQSQVSALEAEVGMEMIGRVGGDMEVRLDFANRMNALAKELRNEPSPPTPAQAASQLATLGGQIASETNSEKRQALIEAYLEKSRYLEPEQQIEATMQLHKLAQAFQPESTANLNIADQWSAVERAQGSEKQAAIRQLVESIHQLPLEQQIEHMQRLNKVAGQTGSSPL